MYRYRKKSSLQNVLKDYMIPIIWGIIILIIAMNVIFGGKGDGADPLKNPEENQSPIVVNFWDKFTEASVRFGNKEKETISDGYKLFKWENIIVKEWDVLLSFEDGSKMRLNKIANLIINDDWSYTLNSSDAWINTKSSMQVNMKYGIITAGEGSIVSLTQNEASSSAYVLRGTVVLKNKAGQRVTLSAGEKASISRSDTANASIDLSNEKASIGEYFKNTDWFALNGWASILLQNNNDVAAIIESGKYILISGIKDEMRVDASQIDFSGELLWENAEFVTINNIDISLDDRMFTQNSFPLKESVNDVIIKIFDADKNLLEKILYTVYTSNIDNSSNTSNSNSTIITPNSDIDVTQFSFTAPSTTGKFSTTNSEITIRGKTTAEGVAKVEVNGFKLASFNGSTWRYHAFSRFENLQEGTNTYKVEYFDENDAIIFTDFFHIIKREKTAAAPSDNENSESDNTISAEADI